MEPVLSEVEGLRMTKKAKAYARAGVDVDLANRLKRQTQSLVRQTHGPEVLGRIGGFGGLFRANFRGMREPVLVASIDGVGTKLKIVFAMNKHDTVGADLVNHCSLGRASAFLPRLHWLRKTRTPRVPAITSWVVSCLSSRRLLSPRW